MTWTPEGEVKTGIKRLLKTLENCYSFWPVQMGMGARTVDVLGCYKQRAFGIEVKKPGGCPTAIQAKTLRAIHEAGGVSFWCDNLEDFKTLWRYGFGEGELRSPGKQLPIRGG